MCVGWLPMHVLVLLLDLLLVKVAVVNIVDVGVASHVLARVGGNHEWLHLLGGRVLQLVQSARHGGCVVGAVGGWLQLKRLVTNACERAVFSGNKTGDASVCMLLLVIQLCWL